ncbi:LysR family transcriptional regulator [Acinetobacter sp. S40]|uniref:LysR family transcriptional regulator n=1 Tax=unclassified Acinetobacter TaxID=196816 RepID=UPI00190997BF|nr:MULTISPECIES: LysR family transcriptional regulator [unclassified Acinetobacter]MBJ9983840.1 LysR family transcriptional regulator [Acinetobacter sp. S40]MBK0065036.1 LysR family transcriptional regulator [Acinetobacter sp. S55]MBK0065304.1 LysR family transcriptional regulator [Acinetobacter sp. S54]
MRFDFFDLQLFLHVVDTGSLTKGAERSAVSLQAASERIKKLERHFQSALFIRHATGVELTIAGQTLLQHAQHLMDGLYALEQEMQTFQRQTSQHLTLWCNSSAQSEYLPMLLPKYLIEHPQLQIELHEAESNDIIVALQKGQAELGLISSFFAPNDTLETQIFAEDPLVFICAPDHPFAKQQQLDFADILRQDFIGLLAHHSLQQSIETQAKSLHHQLHYRLRLPSFSAIAQVVANGVGVAIMPLRAASYLQKIYTFSTIALTGAWANRKLLLASREFANLSPNYQDFALFLIANKPQSIEP